ncbi:MAG: hypothetical protein ACFFDK_10840 [Promethearchaeota archaeon]
MNENSISNDEFKTPPRYITGTKSHIKILPVIVLIFIIYGVYISTILFSTEELVPLIYGSAITDIIILFLLIPTCCFLLILFTPYIALIYYKIYIKIFGDSKLYFLDMRVQLGEWKVSNITKRAILPGLMICALSQVIVTAFGIIMWVPEDMANNIGLALFNAAFIVYPIIIILLVPLWLLFDSGVMSKTKPEVIYKKRTPETIEPIQQFFITKYRGFGGITFLLSFFSVIIQMILQTISPLMILFIIFLPFLGLALFIPAQIVYEKVLPFMTRKIHKLTKLHDSELSIITVEQCPACNPKFKKKSSK